jgi:hypothetical protein
MKKIVFITVILFISFLYAFQLSNEDPAANFLNSLNEEQIEKTQFPFDNLSRNTWHFLPGTMWPRAGIQLHELNPNQKELFFELLRVYLSKSGYDKTMRIIDLERVLAELSGNIEFRDPEKYFVAFYGDPKKDDLWAWSFEGHHISLNFSILNDKISIAPRFMGANPAMIKEGERKGERTLANEEDYGFKFMNSLSDGQKQKAIFQESSFAQIVTSNSTEVGPLQPVGIKMQELRSDQQLMLFDLINEYISTMPIELANKRMNNLRSEEFDEIRFGWAGSTERGKSHYYRVQGKTFLIEFDNTQNNANHIHLVWRDFEGDFGRDLIKEHYQKTHHQMK